MDATELIAQGIICYQKKNFTQAVHFFEQAADRDRTLGTLNCKK